MTWTWAIWISYTVGWSAVAVGLLLGIYFVADSIRRGSKGR